MGDTSGRADLSGLWEARGDAGALATVGETACQKEGRGMSERYRKRGLSNVSGQYIGLALLLYTLRNV